MKWLVPQTQKLIQFLQQQIEPPPSGKLLRRVLEARLCRVNGTVERFGSADVKKGAIVELSSSWQSVLTPVLSRFKTLFEDENLLIVNKPTGWICSDTECIKSFGSERYLVHRLDRETTGALLLAKNQRTKDALIDLFRTRSVEKTYAAIVDGVPKEENGHCKSYFAKIGAFEGQTLWGSRSRGLLAETHWRVVSKGEKVSLLICQPLTGRTHQIRVHLAEMGHPILVDRQYAKSYRSKFFASRPLLHATKLRFKHPWLDQQIDVCAPLASDFQTACQTILLSTINLE